MIRFGWKGPHNCELKGLIRSELEDMPGGYESMDFEEMFKWRDDQVKSDEKD